MNLFTHVKRQVAILEVCGEYITLHKAGLYWKGTCPFHTEKTASFTVSPHKEIFYCFGCHAGGDAITFIAKIENCTALEAAKLLIERRNLSVPEALMHEVNSSSSAERNRYFDICKMVAQWAHEQLLKHHHALTYLQERSIGKDQINYFVLGYFPGGPAALKQLLAYAQKHHFLADDLIQANILMPGKVALYSPFEERILFPITDQMGRHCGFGGRVFKAHDDRPKYYNSRENSNFIKGSLLFGLDKARLALQKSDSAFLVEGYIDCIAMVQHGFANTVATLGTACTIEHLTMLSRYTKQLYVLYDGDKAGQEAIARLTHLCWQVNLELKVIRLPESEDPASFLYKGQELQPLIAQAKDIFEFFIMTSGKDFGTKTIADKLQLTQNIINLIIKIEDPLKRDILLQKAAGTLQIPFTSLQQAYTRGAQSRASYEKSGKYPLKKAESSEKNLPIADGVPALEKKLFFAILQNIQLLHRGNEEYLIEYLPKPLSTIIHKLSTAQANNPTIDFTQFFDMLESTEQQYVSKTLLEDEADGEQDFAQLLILLQKKHWKHIVHTIKVKLAEAEDAQDHAKIESILQNFLTLKKKVLHKDLL